MMQRLRPVRIACPSPRPCYTTTPSHTFSPRTLTANTIHYNVPGDAMNMFPFVMAYVMDSSSDSDSSTSSSSDSDSDDDEWYLDAMMNVVEQELMHEMAHEPEPYHAEPGRPRTLEEGMAEEEEAINAWLRGEMTFCPPPVTCCSCFRRLRATKMN